MFSNQFTREEIADAHVAYYKHRNGSEPGDTIEGLSQFSAHKPYGRHSQYEEYSDLDSLKETSLKALACYCALVAQRDGASEAADMLDRWIRIQDPAGVTIVVQNSDDDPTQINVHIQDEIASAWCDANGSLDGGTWEEADGPDFCYDILYWRPGLFEELQAEGYAFDFSQYSEPDEHDIAVARHASECEACDYDWHKADDHVSGATYHVVRRDNEPGIGPFADKWKADEARRQLYLLGVSAQVERRTTDGT